MLPRGSKKMLVAVILGYAMLAFLGSFPGVVVAMIAYRHRLTGWLYVRAFAFSGMTCFLALFGVSGVKPVALGLSICALCSCGGGLLAGIRLPSFGSNIDG
jgi:hypothetical protein